MPPVNNQQPSAIPPPADSLGTIDAAGSLDTPYTTSQSVRGGQPAPPPSPESPGIIARLWKKLALGVLILLLLLGGFAILRGSNTRDALKAGRFDAQTVPLEDVAAQAESTEPQTVTINGRLQVSQSIVLAPTTPPVGAVAGQIYYDQATNQVAYYNGTEFLNLVSTTSQNAFIQNTTTVNNFFSNITNATAGVTTPAGTPNRLPKFTSAQTIGDSIVTDNSTYLEILGGLNLIADTTIENLSFWDDSTVPANPNFIDLGGAVEVGVKFSSDVPGVINGLRFYRGTSSVGPYTGSLWSNTGTLMAQAVFPVNGFGWQEVSFANPVPISPDTTYIASYHTNGGGYAVEGAYFGAAGVDNGPIHALVSGLDGGNGVFRYNATPIFPTQTANSSNYWIDIDFSGAIYSEDSRIRINNAQISSSDLANDSNLAKRTSSQIFSGRNTFRPVSNTVDGFSIQQSDTTVLFSVDTLNNQVLVGPMSDGVGTILVLGRKITAGDPPGVDGAIYFNTAQQSFRCYRNGAWDSCAQPEVDRSFTVYEEFLGGQNTSFATDSFGNLGWHARAIGANGTLSFDTGTPAPAADRPGVLALQTPAVVNQGTTFLLSSTGTGSLLLARGNTIKTAVAVGSTDQVLRVGLHSQVSTTNQPLSGVWWEADPAVNPNWRYCSGDGATVNCASSTVAVTPDTWVRLEIRITAIGAGTSAYSAGINGTFFAVGPTTIDSTNRVSPAFSCYSTVASSQNCYWDYYQLKGTTASAR